MLRILVLSPLILGCAKDPPPPAMAGTTDPTTGAASSEDSGSTGPPDACAVEGQGNEARLTEDVCGGYFFVGGPAGVPIGDVPCADAPPELGVAQGRPTMVSTPDGDMPGIELFPPEDGGEIVAAYNVDITDWTCPVFEYAIPCIHDEECDFTWRITFHDNLGGFLQITGDPPSADAVREFLQVNNADVEVQMAAEWPADGTLKSAVFVDPRFSEFLAP